GIHSEADAAAAIEAGADKVSLNTAALKTPELITTLANRYGSQAVIVAIDAKSIRLKPDSTSTNGWPGRNGARCSATPIGPMPGPPPPCGMANVLCRFRWQTSAPIVAGLVRPTCAFMLAPSM
ncbi:MAG: hypothetical protein HC767_02575, partial [Akkermansiaceae bacterium]|nr:hypothetical protein [Akkermansiaceae bacterium]